MQVTPQETTIFGGLSGRVAVWLRRGVAVLARASIAGLALATLTLECKGSSHKTPGSRAPATVEARGGFAALDW